MRGDAGLAEARERLATLEAGPPKDRDGLLRAVDELQLALTNIASSVSVVVNVNWEHMGNDAYSASYAAYLWSDVIASDIRSGFTNGLMDIAPAHRYRDLVLAPGGNIPAADAVANFLGRPYSSNAFKARLAGSG